MEDDPTDRQIERSISALCENPLLLQLALDYWKREHAFPGQIVPLFRSWLENILKAEGGDAVSSITRELALTLIAEATPNAPITGERAISLLLENGLRAPILNELVACDAVRVNGVAIEVQHEALTDYLRAKNQKFQTGEAAHA